MKLCIYVHCTRMLKNKLDTLKNCLSLTIINNEFNKSKYILWRVPHNIHTREIIGFLFYDSNHDEIKMPLEISNIAFGIV